VTRKSYLAFDLGAESGRAVLARLEGGIVHMNEVHRFANTPLTEAGSLHWDVQALWGEMRRALALVSEDEALAGIAVDSWGVDYALLGAQGELLENPWHYRDARNVDAMAEALDLVSRDEIYAATGVQFMPINTIFQLFAATRQSPARIAAARRFVMIPDLFNYWLTGEVCCEFTDASTTQLMNPQTRTWAVDLMDRLNLPARLAAPIVEAGSIIGPILADVAAGGAVAGTPVIAAASHDTASAVAAITARDGTAFISSGTWSLVGTELDEPVLTSRSMHLNFSNEGGVGGTTRLLKNIAGMWLLQACARVWTPAGQPIRYDGLLSAADDDSLAFRSLFDPDHHAFFHPPDMPAAIAEYCRETAQPAPDGPAAFTRAILESLALKYRCVLESLERLTGVTYSHLRIVGGGSRNTLLNQFAADAIGRPVIAGPVEATALGNIAVQMVCTGAAASLAEARAIVDRSFPTRRFDPTQPDKWERQYRRFQGYLAETTA
jgi:rhamnulokinase